MREQIESIVQSSPVCLRLAKLSMPTSSSRLTTPGPMRGIDSSNARSVSVNDIPELLR